MEQEMKGFWNYFILLVSGAVVNLAGALIGKTIVGYVLYGLGLACVITVFVLAFIKKSYFKGENRKFVILGLILGILLAASTTLLITSSTSNSMRMTPPAGFSAQTQNLPSSQTNQSGSTTGMTRSGSQSGASGFGTSTGNTGTSTGNTGTGTGNTGTMNNRRSSANSGTVKIIGWVLLGLGAALLLYMVLRLLTKKTNFKGDRWKMLLLGLLVGALLASSTALLLTSSTTPSFALNSQNAPGALLAGNGTTAVTATVAATETATETITPEPLLTSTPIPTATATVEVTASMVVCLNYDIQVGINIHNFPSNDSKNIGSIPAAACFTVDGKNAGYEGWYHMADNQQGFGSITIWGKEDANGLWVNGANFDKSAADLSTLPEVAVAATK
jgi:gas vesicle protein